MALAPCPTGWSFDPKDAVEIGKLAVKTGFWPLKEYMDGQMKHTKIPNPRLPVEEYLKRQGRFAHLFRPERNEALIRDIQARVDAYWAGVS
jgi:pyruvate ferredoxin oxidoreductase beta subunit